MRDFSRKRYPYGISYKIIDKQMVADLEEAYLSTSTGINLFNLFSDYGLQLVQEIASKNAHTSPHFLRAVNDVMGCRVDDD